jgi:hypothetical protein
MHGHCFKLRARVRLPKYVWLTSAIQMYMNGLTGRVMAQATGYQLHLLPEKRHFLYCTPKKDICHL